MRYRWVVAFLWLFLIAALGVGLGLLYDVYLLAKDMNNVPEVPTEVQIDWNK